MSAWRRVAIERLATLRRIIEEAETIGMLWIELNPKFERAHREPVDAKLIRAIYDYAWWCIGQGDDVATATVVGFYEHLPMRKSVVESMPEYLTKEQFLGFKEVFRYFLSPKEHADFIAGFLKRRDEIEREKYWKNAK